MLTSSVLYTITDSVYDFIQKHPYNECPDRMFYDKSKYSIHFFSLITNPIRLVV